MTDNKRRRPNDPVVDYTISGMTIDDMMKRDVKPEYRITLDDRYRVDSDKKEDQPEVKEEKK